MTLHSVSEVDSGKMDAVVRVFAGIGDENDAGIELAHHMRKPAAGTNGDYDVHDIRGVAAITDAVRAARVLNRMNERDAESAGCTETERLSRFRVDRAKGNYSPAQAATWRQFVSVELANGDDVGVVAPWHFPGQGENTPEKAAADQKAEHVFLQLLDKFLARNMNVSANSGHNYAPAKVAEEQNSQDLKSSPQSCHAPPAGRRSNSNGADWSRRSPLSTSSGAVARNTKMSFVTTLSPRSPHVVPPHSHTLYSVVGCQRLVRSDRTRRLRRRCAVPVCGLSAPQGKWGALDKGGSKMTVVLDWKTAHPTCPSPPVRCSFCDSPIHPPFVHWMCCGGRSWCSMPRR